MRVLGLCSYPVEAAGTRYRMRQYIEPLAKKGIELEISPFLDKDLFTLLYQNKSLARKGFGVAGSVARRFAEIFKARNYDLLFVQREAMIFGPAVFEWIFQKIGNVPMILDLDDATYLAYESPTYGKIGSYLKFFGKTDKLIKRAETVVCGNRYIAEYVESKGTKAVVVPTVVDTDKFFPVEKNNEVPVVGWIGTHSTFPLLQSVFPVLQRLAQKHHFILKIVGSGSDDVKIEGVEIENLKWNLEREIADFQSLDIGLYPITTAKSLSDQWILAKSGFKAIQYLSIGIPFVMSPVGGCAEIGEHGKTHFNASGAEDWYNTLDRLLSDAGLRKMMGTEGRKYSLENYSLPVQAEKLSEVINKICENVKTKRHS